MEENKTEFKKAGTEEWLVEGYPPLKGEVGKVAIEGQLLHYPKVARTRSDPPIVGQELCSHSFMFFKEPRKLRNGIPCFGFFKCRGNKSDEGLMEKHASRLISHVDSKFPIKIGPTGSWLPLTEDEVFNRETLDVKTSGDEKGLRDQATREKEADDRRVMREISEKEQEVKTGGDIYDDPTSLTYYSMKRVTEMTICEALKNQIRQYRDIREKLVATRIDLKKLEIDHPEYPDKWIDRYNEEREKTGIPEFIPGENQFEEYERITLADLEGNLKVEGKAEDGDEIKKLEEEIETDTNWKKTFLCMHDEEIEDQTMLLNSIRAEIASRMKTGKDMKIKIEVIVEE